MPAPDFHNYAAKLRAAERRADPDATEAQREAGVAKVGRIHCHGLTVSVEYPKGAIRRGVSADGSKWARAVKNPYGYINGTTTQSDGEQLDVWIGDHLESQVAFLFSFLTPAGEHDEYKCILGARNLAEAKDVIRTNYPESWIETRVGEIRGIFMPELKAALQKKGLMKKKSKKSAAVDVARLAALVSPY